MGGLENKHLKRDLKIPEYRLNMLKEIEKDLSRDKNVIGIFYGGSIGNQNTDLYSDIDLRIIVTDEVFEEYRLNKKNRAENWGNVLFFEDFSWTNYSVAHFDNFIKVDTFYYRKEDIQPSVWLKNIKIVRDQEGFIEEICKESKQLSYFPTAQEVQIWRTKFFAYVHEIYRRVNRKEVFYALNCLDNLRLSMVIAWYMDKGLQPNDFGDWSKYEGERSELNSWQIELLEDWHSSRRPDEILEVLRKVIPEFKKTHKSLCVKVNIEEDSEWVDKIIRMVL